MEYFILLATMIIIIIIILILFSSCYLNTQSNESNTETIRAIINQNTGISNKNPIESAIHNNTPTSRHRPFIIGSVEDQQSLNSFYIDATDEIPVNYPLKSIGACPDSRALSQDLPIINVPMCKLIQNPSDIRLETLNLIK
jgi:hypothetical protein